MGESTPAEADHERHSGSKVRDCGELSLEDEVGATAGLPSRGAMQTFPGMGLFWIMDARTGARRLLDVEALDIVRQLPVAFDSPRPRLSSPVPVSRQPEIRQSHWPAPPTSSATGP
ncbi:hypothetical protein [Arthrobacter sp. UYCu723]